MKPITGKKTEDDVETRVGWRMAGLATEVVSHVIAGGLLGWLLDSWLCSKNWVMIGLLAGIATGLLSLIRGAMRLHRQLDGAQKRPQEAQNGDSGSTGDAS